MSFDRLAPHYRWMERVLAGGKLQGARTRWLGAVDPPRRALLVGEGNGRFLEAALRAWPSTRFLCVDQSPAMLDRARRRVPPDEQSRVQWECSRLPDGMRGRMLSVDLVATHFFLDCFAAPTLAAVVDAIANVAEDRATWMIADFALPPRGWRRWRARGIHSVMYAFFRVFTGLEATSVVAPDPFLKARGFELAHTAEMEWGLIRSSVWRRDGG